MKTTPYSFEQLLAQAAKSRRHAARQLARIPRSGCPDRLAASADMSLAAAVDCERLAAEVESGDRIVVDFGSA